MNKFATLLFIPFMGVLLSACSTNPILENTLEDQEETFQRTKRNIQQGATVHLYGNTDFKVENLAGGYVEATFNYSTPYTFTYTSAKKITRTDGGYFVVGTSWGGTSISNTTREFTINADSTDLTYYFTTTSTPRVTIHNDFEAATGEFLLAVNDQLEMEVQILGHESATYAIDYLDGLIFLHSPTEQMLVGTFEGGSDIQTEGANWTFSAETALEEGWTDLYFSPFTQSFVLWNNSLNYIEYQLGDNPWLNEDGWRSLTPGQRVSIYIVQTITIRSTAYFQIDYMNNTYDPTYGGDYNQSVPWHDYYFAEIEDCTEDITTVVPQSSPTENDEEAILASTFATIATSLAALIPLLEIKVFSNVSIGFLLLIPFTYSLIVLIFKLIKK